MKSFLTWILAAVNLILLAGLAERLTHGDIARAQAAPQRRVSDYILAPMEQSSGQTGIVGIIDENTGQMAAVSYTGRGLATMAPIDLERTPMQGGPRNGNLNNYGGRGY